MALSIDLRGRSALVFGAGCVGDWAGRTIGNGEAAALAYARAGARVACVDHVEHRAAATADRIVSEGGQALVLTADVADNASVQRAVESVRAQWDTLDILHNNVGLSQFGDPVSMSESDWDHVFAVNVKSVFLACKHALPLMRAQRRGVITNISSILAVRVSEYDLISYNASKAAMDQATRTLAVSNAPYGIRANSIQPGLMDTPQIHAHQDVVGLHGDIESTVRVRDAMCPTLKQGSGWDIGNLAAFLASDLAEFVNGQVIAVDGGLCAKQAAQAHPIPEELK